MHSRGVIMIKTERIEQIQDYVLVNDTVSLDELVKVFDVSKNTIRRDIQQLVERGKIIKVYGGVAANHATLKSFNERQTRNQQQKRSIAKAAANFVEDGDIIYIDSGTTTLEMVENLQSKNVTIITNNLDFIFKSFPYDNLNVISTGGVFDRKTKSFVSLKNMDLLKSYNINKAFMASTGITISNGVTHSSPLESEIKQNVVKKSSTVFLLVDHCKFDKYALMTYCDMDEVDYIITDKVPSENYQEYTKRHDIQLVISDKLN
jgi:DeoR family myo-inositol catabolism operon transcriptional repressor